MKILILLRDLSTNGISTYNRTLAAELQAQGHEVIVWPSDERFASAERHRWPLSHPLLEPLLRHYIRRLKPDLLFVNHFSQARFADRLKRSSGIPWVACMHNGHAQQRMQEWAALFASASGVVTMCESLQQEYQALIQQQLGNAQIPVLLSRLPIASPPLRRPAPKAPLTLAYCARLSSQKGPRCADWLQAIASLPEAKQHKVLVIGGGSYLGRLQALAGSLALDVEFTGMVADTGPYLDRSDLITGAGYALLEGLLRGCGAVGLGFGGCFGAVTNENLERAIGVNFGDHAIQPLPADSATIAREIQRVIASLGTAEASVMLERARRYFEPQGVVADLVQFLASVTARP